MSDLLTTLRGDLLRATARTGTAKTVVHVHGGRVTLVTQRDQIAEHLSILLRMLRDPDVTAWHCRAV